MDQMVAMGDLSMLSIVLQHYTSADKCMSAFKAPLDPSPALGGFSKNEGFYSVSKACDLRLESTGANDLDKLLINTLFEDKDLLASWKHQLDRDAETLQCPASHKSGLARVRSM